MVARPCLRTPKHKIISTSATVKRKLLEFLTAVSKGLVPPETPPGMGKHRRRKLPGLMGIDPVEDVRIISPFFVMLSTDAFFYFLLDLAANHTSNGEFFERS